MFSPDFYPTPPAAIKLMFEGEDFTGKVGYDPEGGAGALVEAMQEAGCKEVISSELDARLRAILQTKCKVIAHDFFEVTAEMISHVDYIVMNPPFSNADKHILHAWEIMPPGCKLISLCNEETLKNPYSKTRQQLKEVINTYGSGRDIGAVFSDAERKTMVLTGLIRLQKPADDYKQEFAGFFLEDEEEPQGNGVMSYNAIRDLVNRYVECVKIFDEQLQTAIRLNDMQSDYLSAGELAMSITKEGAPMQRNDFKKAMQKAGWSWVFSKLNMEKYATRGLKADINKFVETQEGIPFTMKNIYKMLEIVIGTTGARMDKAVLEVFDKVTSHSEDNRHGLEGWKTNSHYLMTRKFILPRVSELSWERGWKISYNSGDYAIVDDLHKALCYLTGKNFDDIGSVWDMNNAKHEDGTRKVYEFNTWYEFGLFKMKSFKKGTMHFEFISEDVWAQFNRHVAKLKGYPLPEKKSETRYQAKQNGRDKETQTAYKPQAQKPVVLATFQI